MALNSQESSQELIDRYFLFVRHKYLIFLALVLALIGAVSLNSILTPVYSASTSMIIDKEKVVSPITGQQAEYESWLSETMTFNTHFKLITSRQVLELAVAYIDFGPEDESQALDCNGSGKLFQKYICTLRKNFKLLVSSVDNSEEPAEPNESSAQAIRLLNMIEVEPVDDTRLINVISRHRDPEIARQAADAVAQAYIDFNVSNRMEASQHTLKLLKDSLYEMKGSLEEAETEFAEYKQKVKLISFEKSQEMVVDKVREFNDAYFEARNRRLELNTRLAQLRKIIRANGQLDQLGSLVTNAIISSLYNELVAAELELSRLSKVYKSKHPKMIQIKSKIYEIKGKLKAEIGKELKNLEVERSILLSKEKVIQKTVSEYEKDAMDTGRKQLRHDILKRNLDMNQELYDSILSRLKEVDLLGKVDVSNVRIVEAAILPEKPVGPNKIRNLIIAGILGLIAGVGISFFREYLDRSLHSEDDIQNYLKLPVLGTIPLAEKSRG